MLAKTHSFILREALKFTKKKFKGYEKYIEKGCIKEDHPNLTFDFHYFQIIGTDHFYNPEKNTGYSRFFGNAKQRGMYFFDKSIKLYKKGELEEAYLFLGKSLHMLADIASPSHTKLEFHIIDIFEHHIEKFLPNFSFNFRSKIVPKINSEHCFDRLAKISYDIKFKKRFFADTLHVLGIHINENRHKKLHKISNKLLEETILYSAVLLSIFYSNTRKNFIKKIIS